MEKRECLLVSCLLLKRKPRQPGFERYLIDHGFNGSIRSYENISKFKAILFWTTLNTIMLTKYFSSACNMIPQTARSLRAIFSRGNRRYPLSEIEVQKTVHDPTPSVSSAVSSVQAAVSPELNGTRSSPPGSRSRTASLTRISPLLPARARA